ncbi:MAG: GntR family transcriptional regulator [Alphaproteobacteria bacterium]|nr:MAG: GntR family transcriptional regulator [Alphaproteobacteria bacterium]
MVAKPISVANGGPVQVRIPKAAEVVAGELRKRIIRGEIKEGEALPSEAELIEQFGVSRPTMREAVRVLESENLIQTSRGVRGGARVLRPHPETASRSFGVLLQLNRVTIGDIYRTRQIIEPPAARIVAERRDPAALHGLRTHLQYSRDVVDDDRLSAEASTRFFRAVVEFSGVQTLILMSSMLDTIMNRYNRHLWMTGAGERDHIARKRRAIRAKEKLIAMIEVGDGPAAEAYLAEHMKAVADLLERWKIAGQALDVTLND